MITIITGTNGYAGPIAVFSQETFLAAFGPANKPENMDKFMKLQFSRKMLENQVGEPGNYFFLAEEDGQLLGYVRLVDSRSPDQLAGNSCIEIARIYAAPNVIGKGVGKQLMQASIDFARSLQKEVIWLGVWENNQHAIDFNKKWGFEKLGTQVFMLGDEAQTDWLMKKKVEISE